MEGMCTFDTKCNDLHKQIKDVAAQAKQLIETAKNSTPLGDDSISNNKGEMIANATLAYRHLEDASMRIGKAIQAYDGGVSVYDRETTVGA